MGWIERVYKMSEDSGLSDEEWAMIRNAILNRDRQCAYDAIENTPKENLVYIISYLEIVEDLTI